MQNRPQELGTAQNLGKFVLGIADAGAIEKEDKCKLEKKNKQLYCTIIQGLHE